VIPYQNRGGYSSPGRTLCSTFRNPHTGITTNNTHMHARTHLSHCPWKQKLLQHTRCGWWFFYLHSEQDTTSEKSHPFPLPLPLHFLLLPLYPSPKQCQSTGFIHALYSKCWSSSNEAACAIIKLIGMTWPRSEWIRQLSRLRVDTLTTTPLNLFFFLSLFF